MGLSLKMGQHRNLLGRLTLHLLNSTCQEGVREVWGGARILCVLISALLSRLLAITPFPGETQLCCVRAQTLTCLSQHHRTLKLALASQEKPFLKICELRRKVPEALFPLVAGYYRLNDHSAQKTSLDKATLGKQKPPTPLSRCPFSCHWKGLNLPPRSSLINC